jgi:hypothetical protein
MLERLKNAPAIAAFACLLIGFGVVEWQMSLKPSKLGSPHPAPQIEKHATAEQHATESISENRDKPQSLWVPVDSVGLYTLVLAAFTGLLVAVSGIQGYFLLRADRTARIAANAANLSARAAIGIQLPIIRVTPSKLGFGSTTQKGVRTEECSVHDVSVANLGATKAFPTEIMYGFALGDRLPDKPSYRFIDKFPPNVILEPGIENRITKTLWGLMLLEKGQRVQIMGGNCLWFYCAVLYRDFMDEPRSHGFCWCWSYVGDGLDWRVDDTPAYNRKK